MFYNFFRGKSETNNFCWISSDNCIRRDRRPNNASAANYSTSFYMTSGQKSNICSNPDIFVNNHIFIILLPIMFIFILVSNILKQFTN